MANNKTASLEETRLSILNPTKNWSRPKIKHLTEISETECRELSQILRELTFVAS